MSPASLATPHRHAVAREGAAAYAAFPPDPAGDAVAQITTGLEQLGDADLYTCTNDDLGEALLAIEQAQRLLAAQQARLVRTFEQRCAYRDDACVSTGGWLRLKTNLGPGAIQRRVKRAELLRRMPALSAALDSGAIGAEHVDAVLYRATARRMEAITQADETIAELARNAEPRHVSVAVQRIVDAVDADGQPDPKPCETEELREVGLRDGLYGMGDLTGATTVVLSELLRRVRDVYGPVDTADTPDEERLTRGQRFHDSLVRALTVALDHHPSTFGGVKSHFAVFVDLQTLLGNDELARIKPRLASGKVLDAETARHLAATTNPTLRFVLGMGPWRPITVSRTQRTLPGWLRSALQMAYPHCMGPGCDVPFGQCDADHVEEWEDGGETALFNSLPDCRSHNNLKHQDGWSVTFDMDTGAVTWTSNDGTRVINVPPPDI